MTYAQEVRFILETETPDCTFIERLHDEVRGRARGLKYRVLRSSVRLVCRACLGAGVQTASVDGDGGVGFIASLPCQSCDGSGGGKAE